MSDFTLQQFYDKKKQLKQDINQIESQFKNLSGKKKVGLASMLVSNLVINKGNSKLNAQDQRSEKQSLENPNLNIFDNVYSLLFVPFLKRYTVNAIQHDSFKNKFIGYALLYGLPILLKQFNQYMDKKHQA